MLSRRLKAWFQIASVGPLARCLTLSMNELSALIVYLPTRTQTEQVVSKNGFDRVKTAIGLDILIRSKHDTNCAKKYTGIVGYIERMAF